MQRDVAARPNYGLRQLTMAYENTMCMLLVMHLTQENFTAPLPLDEKICQCYYVNIVQFNKVHTGFLGKERDFLIVLKTCFS